MINDLIQFASKFITLEEIQATIVLIFISVTIIISAVIIDKYEKKISKGSD
jgi:hypothetical protein